MTHEMRALSIRQPWATLILAGIKPVENRTWTTRRRGLVLIHAGRRDDLDGLRIRIQHGWLPPHVLDYVQPYAERCPRGGYIGTAVLTDVHKAAAGCCAPWGEPECYHWRFTSPTPLQSVVTAPGQLGLYRPPPGIALALNTSTREGSPQ